MRARSRSCPRRLVAGLVAAGTIEIAAGARDAVEDALRAVHHDGAGDARRVEGHERARRRADRMHAAGGGEGRNCGGDDGAPAPRPVRDLELYMVDEVY